LQKIYNKLVRDRIPEIIRADGNVCTTEIMQGGEYIQALREKLVEEALEAAATVDIPMLINELADVYEVMDALMARYDITPASVLAAKEERRNERGGFAQHIRLIDISSPDA
jgi:predicted house-cleaning noncanonical NTP pyrophosphatase (MazG superfamily)